MLRWWMHTYIRGMKQPLKYTYLQNLVQMLITIIIMSFTTNDTRIMTDENNDRDSV